MEISSSLVSHCKRQTSQILKIMNSAMVMEEESSAVVAGPWLACAFPLAARKTQQYPMYLIDYSEDSRMNDKTIRMGERRSTSGHILSWTLEPCHVLR